MRNLQTRDLFDAGRLIMKLGVRNEIEEIAQRKTRASPSKLTWVLIYFSAFWKRQCRRTRKKIFISLSQTFSNAHGKKYGAWIQWIYLINWDKSQILSVGKFFSNV